MEKITKHCTLEQINTIPEFHWFESDDMSGDEFNMNQLSLEKFAEFGGWNVESICEGYNHLLRIARGGNRIFYPLWSDEELKKQPALKERYLVHFPVKEKRPFAVICAGGGYAGCASMIEGYPTCKQLNEAGYHAFELNYRCGENAKVPNPIDDMAKAISFILENAEMLNVDREGYAIGGFSAGGHLAACFASENIGYRKYNLPGPAAVFLAYPVITFGKEAHEMSRRLFLGENADDVNMQMLYSAEKQVTAAYPATFIWQCDRDSTVSIKNSQQMVESLIQHKVPYIYETFDSDVHGWGAGDGTLAEGWVRRAADFWAEHR